MVDEPATAGAAGSTPPNRRTIPFPLIIGGFILVGVGIAVLVGVQLRAGPTTAGPSGPGRIAAIEPAGTLVTIAPDGTGERLFQLPGGTFSFPTYGPDGAHLAVIANDASGGAVYILNDSGGASPDTLPPPAFKGPDESPIYANWSPDGQRLAVLSGGRDGLAVHSVTVDGSAPPSVVQSGSPLFWDWAGASRLLVHVGGVGATAYVGEVPIGGGAPESQVEQMGRFQAAVVSFDERYRAYAALGEDPAGFVTVEGRSDASSKRVAVAGPTALGWSPTDDTLAFIATSDPYPLPVGHLMATDVAAGDPRTLLDDDVVAFYWAPNGRSIAALVLATPEERAAAGGGAVVHVAFVDVATATTTADRLVRLSPTFVDQVLPYFDQYALSHAMWSPQSDAIVLSITEQAGGEPGISIVPADGSDPRRVADGEIAFWSP